MKFIDCILKMFRSVKNPYPNQNPHPSQPDLPDPPDPPDLPNQPFTKILNPLIHYSAKPGPV